MEPRAEPLPVPAVYGTRTRDLDWGWARERLEKALQYWLVTTRPDGTAHVNPVDGLWLDDVWIHGGSAESVRHRNLERNPEAVVHLGDAEAVVVVEGTVTMRMPSAADADRMAATAKAKYGYSPGAAVYRSGVWALVPRRARAWSSYPADATRFVFGQG